METDSVVEGESGGGSAEVCDIGIEGSREQINTLLASAGTTDGSRITTGEEMDGGFVVTKNNSKRVNGAEVGGIGKVLGSGFQLERVRVDGGGKVYVVKPRKVAPNEGGLNGGGTNRRAGRREERKRRQQEVRATNPHLNPVL